jgi:hypothetical protein
MGATIFPIERNFGQFKRPGLHGNNHKPPLLFKNNLDEGGDDKQQN